MEIENLRHKIKQNINLVICSLILIYSQALIAKMPEFSQYSVKKIYTGKPATLNMRSHPIARQFKTCISNALKTGVNFAGHYTIAQWGAGTEVMSCAIVDTKTGYVIGAGPVACIGYEFKINSNLLIVDPPAAIRDAYGLTIPDYVKTQYYVWQNNQSGFLPLSSHQER